jgi:hypothetical protein
MKNKLYNHGNNQCNGACEVCECERAKNNIVDEASEKITFARMTVPVTQINTSIASIIPIHIAAANDSYFNR